MTCMAPISLSSELELPTCFQQQLWFNEQHHATLLRRCCVCTVHTGFFVYGTHLRGAAVPLKGLRAPITRKHWEKRRAKPPFLYEQTLQSSFDRHGISATFSSGYNATSPSALSRMNFSSSCINNETFG